METTGTRPPGPEPITTAPPFAPPTGAPIVGYTQRIHRPEDKRAALMAAATSMAGWGPDVDRVFSRAEEYLAWLEKE